MTGISRHDKSPRDHGLDFADPRQVAHISPQNLDTAPVELEHVPQYEYKASVCISGNPDYSDPDRECRDRAFVAPSGSLGVFDGVGKLEGSAQIAEGAKNLLSRYLEELPLDTSPRDAQKYITGSLMTTRDALTAYNQELPEDQRGATTATVAKIVRNQGRSYLVYGSIGDSRLMVYRPSNDSLRDITLDETAIGTEKPYNKRVEEQQVLDSVKTQQDLASLPLHHQVSYVNRHNIGEHAIGTGSRHIPQTGYREVEVGDIVIGVSDGYTDNLTVEERRGLLREAVEQNGGPGVASVKQITTYMDSTIQKIMKLDKSSENIRVKPDDAAVAALRVG